MTKRGNNTESTVLGLDSLRFIIAGKTTNLPTMAREKIEAHLWNTGLKGNSLPIRAFVNNVWNLSNVMNLTQTSDEELAQIVKR